MKEMFNLNHLDDFLTSYAPWNLSSFEFKFDDTRLSTYHKNKIGHIENVFCCILTLQSLCWLSQFSWDSQQGRDFAKSGRNNFFF